MSDTFQVGDEVGVVIPTYSPSSYGSSDYIDGAIVSTGTVLSVGDKVIAVWPDNGKRPMFSDRSSVFRDIDQAHEESRRRKEWGQVEWKALAAASRDQMATSIANQIEHGGANPPYMG